MARGKELTAFQQGEIVGCHRCGLSIRAIAQKLNHAKSTVSDVLNRRNISHGQCVNRPRTERPKKVQPRGISVLKHAIRSNRASSLGGIRNEFQLASGQSVSVNTLRNEAHLLGYHGRVAVHKPLVTAKNRAARLSWAKKHRNWMVEDWKRVLWR